MDRNVASSAPLWGLLRRRARAVRWAVSLIMIAGGGVVASAQANEQSRAITAMTETINCSSNVRVGFDMQIDPRIGGYAVAGAIVEEFPAECAGRKVVAVVLGAGGQPLATATVELSEGAVAVFDGEPLDARTVTGLHVVPS